jgi:hypothetical protein
MTDSKGSPVPGTLEPCHDVQPESAMRSGADVAGGRAEMGKAYDLQLSAFADSVGTQPFRTYRHRLGRKVGSADE